MSCLPHKTPPTSHLDEPKLTYTYLMKERDRLLQSSTRHSNALASWVGWGGVGWGVASSTRTFCRRPTLSSTASTKMENAETNPYSATDSRMVNNKFLCMQSCAKSSRRSTDTPSGQGVELCQASWDERRRILCHVSFVHERSVAKATTYSDRQLELWGGPGNTVVATGRKNRTLPS